MATDYAKMGVDLGHFYDFCNKVVLYVGAGGKQLLDPATQTKKLIAIDKNADDLRELRNKIIEQRLQDSVEVIAADFEDVSVPADTVYFEFCLHEMEDPQKALLHAGSLAPDIVVYDHSPGSEWLYYTVEEGKVSRSSDSMHRFGIRRRETFQAEQHFADHGELLEKIRTQGPLALERARRFLNARNIVIPMSYELVLL